MRKPMTLKQIEKRLKNGYGSGRGIGYKSFLVAQDVPSTTIVSRVRGLTIKRVYNLFSFLEVACFLVLDSNPKVIDIREQVPLIPLQYTMGIASRLKILHPGLYRGGKLPQLMTTDFLIDVLNENRVDLLAICVKPYKKLEDKRVREKLEVERFYWQERGITWVIVTERDIPIELTRNLQWLYSTRNWYSEEPPFECELIELVCRPLFEALLSDNLPLSISAIMIDKKFGLKLGTCLQIFQYLVAIGIWKVDMLSLIDTAKPVKVTWNIDLEAGGIDFGN